MLALGYPKEKHDPAVKMPKFRSRKKMEEVVSYEEFGKSKD
jgi:hypothetical protein